ncbi:MAG: hypothetical protein QOF39_1108 [Frankiales bacterium]|nr:hypothetical protein [Frankiales bacterium]
MKAPVGPVRTVRSVPGRPNELRTTTRTLAPATPLPSGAITRPAMVPVRPTTTGTGRAIATLTALKTQTGLGALDTVRPRVVVNCACRMCCPARPLLSQLTATAQIFEAAGQVAVPTLRPSASNRTRAPASAWLASTVPRTLNCPTPDTTSGVLRVTDGAGLSAVTTTTGDSAVCPLALATSSCSSC